MSRKKPAPMNPHTRILMGNMQKCCVCQGMPAVIHHINGDRNDNRPANLAALCPEHHKQAHASGIPPILTPEEIYTHKKAWERQCLRHLFTLGKLGSKPNSCG